MKKVKRFLALFLAVMMVLTSADFSALAAENSANPDLKPEDGTTEGQPFISGQTGESTYFRIPAMVTLNSGRIVAAADARWNTDRDGGGLDTLVSYSDDNGTKWTYTVANYLGDNGNQHNTASTAFIDPVLTTDGETVYMVVDLWPAGYALNGADARPDADAENGFDANENLRLSGDDRTSYGYYLKKKDNASADDYYAIMQTGADGAEDTVVEGYTVDEYFNIKTVATEETTTTEETVAPEEAEETVETEETVTRFAFPSELNTSAELEAETAELVNDASNDPSPDGNEYPMVVAADNNASDGQYIDAMNYGDSIKIPYTAEKAGTYSVVFTYASGSTNNKISWSEENGQIVSGQVNAGASDNAAAYHEVTFDMIVETAGDGVLVITPPDSGNGPRLDKFEFTLTEVSETEETSRFIFPSELNTSATLEAESATLFNSGGDDEAWKMEVVTDTNASGDAYINSMNNGDYIEIPYTAEKAGTYRVVFTYASGSTDNKISWSEKSDKIKSGQVNAGASDNAAAYHEVTFDMIVETAGDGVLVITPPDGVDGPRLDKFEFTLVSEATTVPVDSNLFCADSPFKVYPTAYLYLTKSTDGGATWGAPTLINAKKEGEQSYLVGPGAGLVTTDDAGNKTIIIPCYVYDSGSERTSFIYSKNDGATWTRTDNATDITSSEAQLVELSNGTLRCFFRNTTQRLCYVDATWDVANSKYVWGAVVQTDVVTSSYTQLSAISYSKRIDGKEAILVSCPTGPSEAGAAGSDENSRRNGKIFVGLVQKDGSMEWPYSMNVTSNDNYFLYSCMAELKDGSIGILYEPSMTEITYANYTMDQIAPGAKITDLWVADAEGYAAESVVLKQGTSADFTVKGVAEDAVVTATSADESVATASLTGRTLTITAVAAADNAGISTAALIEDDPAIGETTVTVTSGNDTIELNVTVDDCEKDATISVGETIEIAGTTTATSNAYIKVENGSYDSPVVVDISNLEVGESTNMLFVFEKDGSKYVLTSTEGTSNSTAALGLTQINANTDLSEYYWTVTGVTGGYTIQAASGEKQGYYITTKDNDISLDADTSTVFSFEGTSAGYEISYNEGTKYFNNYSAGTSWIAGYGDNGDAEFSLWKTGTVITGLAVGETDVVVDDVTYHVTVKQAERYVTMYVGDKAIYKGTSTDSDATGVVSIGESTTYPYKPASDIGSGKSYLITSQDQNAIVKNEFNSDNKLVMLKDASYADTDYSEHIWTFTSTGTSGQYYVQNEAGAYLKIPTANGAVELVNEQPSDGWPVIVVEGSAAEGYKLSNTAEDSGHKALNNWGGPTANDLVGSYDYTSASTWYLYAETQDPVTVVTAEQVGTVDITIGTTVYHITVKEAVGTYLDTVYLTVGGTATRTNKSSDSDVTAVINDEHVVGAEISADKTTITFTGKAEGHTIVDVGPTRYYVYVSKAVTESVASTEDVVVYVGQTKTLVSEDNGHTPEVKGENFDTYLANYTLKGVHQDLLAVRGNEIIEHGGISAYYVGDQVDLGDCLYTFTAVEGVDNTYNISAVTSAGETVYLHHKKAGNGNANDLENAQIQLTSNGNESFYLKDNDKYLYFYRNNNNQKLNRLDQGTNSGDGYQFELYRPATAEEIEAGTYSVELPGYVKLTSLDDVKENGNQCIIVASYTLEGNDYYYAVYPSLETGNHTQTVQIITEPISGNKFSSVTFTGAAEGETTLTVDTKTYNITVSAVPAAEDMTIDATPFISETGKSSGYQVTALNMSADRTFDLTIGNGYSGNVVWSITDKNDGSVEWATIDANGLITPTNSTERSKTYEGYVVATIDNVSYKIPLTISPAPLLEEGASARLYDIYFESMVNTDVYYAWIYEYAELNEDGTIKTDDNGNEIISYGTSGLQPAAEGQVLYVSQSNKRMNAIDFFAAPEEGYALTYMSATDSAEHYERLEGATPEQTEFITNDGVAGNNQYDHITGKGSAEAASNTILKVISDAQAQGCDGAQGFTRYSGDGDLSSILNYRSEKLPTVTKSVRGVLGASGMADTYRTYTEGMAVTAGEYVYYDVVVQTYDTEEIITYNNVTLEDDIAAVGDAYFYVKDVPDDEDPINQQVSTIDITSEIKTDGDAGVGAVHEYYVVYQVRDEDITNAANDAASSDIVNHVDLKFQYSTEYANGTFEAGSAAEANVLLTDNTLPDWVVDFGLPVEKTVTTSTYYYQATNDSPLVTDYGQVEVTYEEIVENNGVIGYTNTITYTPTKVMEGMDTVTLTGSNGEAYVFNVYPASTVYYEEGFAAYTGDWTGDISKGTGMQALQEKASTEAVSADIDNYGYDVKYANESTGASNGTEAVSSKAGERAQFTFTGSGVDIYANCLGGENPTGTISAIVRNADTNEVEKLLIVNTAIAGTAGDVTEPQNNIGTAYNLPVASINLLHGTHKLSVHHARTKAESDNNTTYPIKLDGFRVYYTLTDQSVYAEHEEASPVFVEMRNAVLDAINLTEVLNTDGAEGTKSIYAEDIAAGLTQVYHKDESDHTAYTEAKAYIVKNDTSADVYETSAKDLLDNGPKNEVFLYPGESLIFGVSAGLSNVQIGMKAVNSTVNLTVSKLGASDESATQLENPVSISSSTDMFYVLGNTDEDTTVTITNTGTTGVLSVTDLKYFGGTAEAGVFYGLSEDDFMPMLTSLGYSSRTETTPEEPEDTTVEDTTKEPTGNTDKNQTSIGKEDTSADDQKDTNTTGTAKPSAATGNAGSTSDSGSVKTAGKTGTAKPETVKITEVAEVSEDAESSEEVKAPEEPEASEPEEEQSPADIVVSEESEEGNGAVAAIGALIVLAAAAAAVIFGLKKKRNK